MQDYRDGKVVGNELLSKLTEQVLARIEKLKTGELDHFVIGRVPEKKELVEVNGLKFVVTHRFENGFRAELFVPTEEIGDAHESEDLLYRVFEALSENEDVDVVQESLASSGIDMEKTIEEARDAIARAIAARQKGVTKP
jgi:hypothetical protein